jgi:hypothetical protein
MSLAQARLRIVPLSLKEANEYVATHHRHHKPVTGHRFSLGVVDLEGELVGVAICGRPVARMIDWHTSLEILRIATDGTDNACSALYGACRRVAKEMGFARILTYTLESEPGTSLRAAGWVQVSTSSGGEWGRPSRARKNVAPTTPKRRWEVAFSAAA